MSQPELGTLRVFVWGGNESHAAHLRSALAARLGAAAPRGERRFVLDESTGADADDIFPLVARNDLAILLADARSGLDERLKRRIAIARLAGLPDLVLAVETHARDGAAGDAFARIAADVADDPGFRTRFAVPLATRPDGVPEAADIDRMLARLADVAHPARSAEAPVRLTVDAADGDGTMRGWAASGSVRVGDLVVASGSGRSARVAALAVAGEERDCALAGETLALRLDPALAVAAGEILSSAADRVETCDQFAAEILWLDAEPLLPGRAYRMRIGGGQTPASVTRIKHRVDAGTAAPLAALTLRAGDRGRINLSLSEPVAFEPFERNRALALFTLHETRSGRTVAAGRIAFALRRAGNIHCQAVDVTKVARAAAKAQRPALLWFTGLSGAGKSTIANLVEKRLFAMGHHTYLLDGDNVRHGLNRDLGFTAQDRVENIRRVAETAKLMVDAGLITLASFISPFRAERQLARDLLAAGEFIEVFVDAPLTVAEARDPKGLYAQARAGRIPNFTGIDSPYEPPEAPELHLETDRRTAEDLADEVVAHLERTGFLRPAGA